MNREVAQKWVDALRSGKYEQGQGRLRTTDNKFCCLGVLCDISGTSSWKKAPAGFIYDDGFAFPPASVREWAELDRSNIWFRGESLSVIELNDTGATFAEIADKIEAEFLAPVPA